VIKTADWIVDMGPAGGNKGGTVVATGTPEEVAGHKASFTGDFLRPLLAPGGRAQSRRTTGPARSSGRKTNGQRKAVTSKR